MNYGEKCEVCLKQVGTSSGVCIQIMNIDMNAKLSVSER